MAISLGGATYSVPHQLIDDEVWVRVDGDEIVATHVSGRGAVKVARHLRSTPGTPCMDGHYPPRPPGPVNRQPKPANPAETEFITLGEGARLWLIEAAAKGTSRIKVKMAEVVPPPGCTAPNASTGARPRRNVRPVRRR